METKSSSKEEINFKLQCLRQSSLKTIIFGCSGSAATIKSRDIIEGLVSLNMNVAFVPTKNSTHFLRSSKYSVEHLLESYRPSLDHRDRPLVV